MLENKKNVRKIRNIIIALIAIIITLGMFINIKQNRTKEIEIETIATKQIEKMKSAETVDVQSIATIAEIELGNGTIIPEYKPEWTKVSSSLNTTDKTLTVTLKGSAYETQSIDSNVSINYASDIISTLALGDIQIFIDEVDVTDRFTNKSEAVDTTVPMKELKTGQTSTNAAGKTEITYEFVLYNFEEAARQTGKSYKELSGNVKLKIKGRGEDSSTYNEDVLTDKYGSSVDGEGNVITGLSGNHSMMETDESGTWIDVTFGDTETNQNANGTMFADFIKPEFTYEFSETTIDKDNKTLTVIFYAMDKYFDSANSGLALSDFYNPSTDTTDALNTKPVFYVDGEAININVTGNTLTDEAVSENGTRIGTKYTLVVKNLQKNPSVEIDNENDGFSYSGIVSVTIPANKFKDYSGNGNNAKTITIGIDDPTTGDGHNSGQIVDLVDPVWKMENIDIDFANNGVTFDLIATDKYYLSNTLTSGMTDNLIPNDKMLLYIDGVLDGDANNNGVLDEGETPNITKTLITTANLETSGTGVKYTIKLSNWDADEHTGTTRIVIPAGTITDQHENTSVQQQFTIGHIDFTKPVIEKVSSTTDSEAKTETIVFKATDKYMDTTDLITIPDEDNPEAPDEITVYIDGEEATGITRELTITAKIVRNTTDGTVTNQATNYTLGENETLIGYEYTLVLSDLEQTRTSINRDREFSDWSGTVQIEIDEGAVKDIQVTNPNGEIAGGNINDETTLKGDFVDFIKPNVTYEYVEGDIDYTGKKFTMVFDITDKYFKESTLATEYANATTDADKLTVLKKYLTIMVDGEDITNDENVTKKITSIENVTATMNKTVDGEIVTGGTYTIGKRFTLEISNLQQDEVDIGDNYLDYSGVITVVVKGATEEDTTTSASDETGNANNTTTITSGVDIPGGTIPDDKVIVDVVDPIWEQADTAIAKPYNNEAEITIKGTDKYIQKEVQEDETEKIYMRKDETTQEIIYDLQPSDITITVTTPSGTTTVTGDQVETEGMTLTITEDADTTLNYGKQYVISLNGYSNDAYQVKLTLREGIIVDQSGNISKAISFILFSSLVETSTETEATSEFLAKNKQEGQTIPQRQYIEQVIFQDDLDGINETKWDVSQLNDGTIWAWYTTRTTNGTTLYTVYIGSYIIINGNVNSSYLFANIGHDTNCKVTGDTTDNELIENLHLLHVDSVTNMSHMFEGCGYANMQSLDLGSEFDTRSVEDMSYMFANCGNTEMITLDLGEKFATSKVADMNNMFNGCGQNKMTTFKIGSATNNTVDINTTLVTDMSGMFQNFGQKLGNLVLGENFDTSAVTNMSNMFNGTGKISMATLNLGNKFNTAKVQNMSGMFKDFGQTAATSLDLGNLFYTISATDMSNMFNGCGTNAMTILDLGPVFTKIVNANTNFITNCGTTNCVIYAPESIYNDNTHLKLNGQTAKTTDYTSGTTIEYTQGTINPVYKPEWEKVSSSLNKTTGEMTVTVKGFANKVGTPISQINYTSDVIYSLSSSQITVYVDGENADSIQKAVSSATETTNETTGNKEVQYTITLSNFEEEFRQNGKSFKEWSGNIALQFAEGTLKDKYGSSVDGDGNVTIGFAGNQSLAEINTGTTTDGDGNTIFATEPIVVEEPATLSANTATTEAQMFTDLIKPEFTYSSSTTVIGNGNNGDTKTVTVEFDVTDNYFSRTDLENDTNGELITVKVDQEVEANSKITKALTKTAILVMNKETKVVTVQATDYTIPSTELKIGERYQLVISGLEQNPNDGFKYSGYVTLGFPDEIIEDLSGNKNNGTTISIGLDENDGNSNEEDDVTGSGTIVDVVDPVWEIVESSAEDGIVKIRGKDKFYASNTLDEDKIKVLVNNAESTEITKALSEPTYIKLDADGNYVTTNDETEAIGVEYTLQLGNVTVSSGGYIGFVPTNAEELVLDEDGGAKYRIENGGNIKLEISEDTLVDKSGNKNIKTTLDAVNMDDTKPEIYDIQKTQDTTAKTETIIFNVTDRNYDPSDKITESEITFYVDGLPTTGVNILSLTSKEIKGQVSGTTPETTQITTLGHQYTLVLNEIDETQTEFVASGREYRELSGTLEVKIAENAAKDMNLNTLNTETTTISDFVDFIKPEVNYKYTDSTQETPGDIDYSGKTFTMVFEILDKYIKESSLKTALENAANEAEKQAVIEEFLTILIDGETPDWTEVGKDLSIEEVEAETAFNKTVDGEIVNDTHVIGYKYTLVLSNLEQLQIKEGEKYLDYSGVITTAIEVGIAKDTTGNENIGTTITSGLDVTGNVQETGDGQVVDVVRPIWEKVSSSANAVNQTATITFRGTDKYYKQSTLTNENIELWINGSKVSSDLITGWTSTNLTDETTSKQYGIEYTATITGFAQTVNQIKLRIPEGMLEDESGNANVVTDLIVYNTLRMEDMGDMSHIGNTEKIEQATDTILTKPFLGESITTEETTGTIIYINDSIEEYAPIARQDIEKIEFTNNLDNLIKGEIPKVWDVTEKEWNIKAEIQRVWDVSAQGDKSILAWTLQTSAPYTVYVGSAYEIFGNQNSRYLLAGIGKGTSSTATTTVVNLNLLNTSSVTNMNSMFYKFGYTAMTSLDLGNFDTSNVTNMFGMFSNLGYTKMASFDLGEKFDTGKVTNMEMMFNKCGYKALLKLNLGDKFNTSNVNDMYAMFYECGYTKMVTLNLGDKFNTGNVTDMSFMFDSTGWSAMTNLYFGSETESIGVIILPDNFDTSNVRRMMGMFRGFGAYKITSLVLGNNFDTSNVTDMNNMFSLCGAFSMTNLDLGDKFDTSNVTDMSRMFVMCGFSKMTSFDLGDKFDTSNVTNMESMFSQFGVKFTSFDLGDKFDTSNVTDMMGMFYYFGYESLTSFDLGDKFDTRNVTDMALMFRATGKNSMTKLDLGPHFTNIPDGTVTRTNSDGSTNTYGAHKNFFTYCGKENGLTIYVPESIYSNRTSVKLNSTSNVTITPETIVDSETDERTSRGAIINPIYKPEWSIDKDENGKEKVYVDIDEENLENSTISIALKGNANYSETISGTDIKINYSSNVTSALTSEDILIYINGELDEGTIQKEITPLNPETAANVTQTLKLSGFEEGARRTGLPFKELSGNIKIKILGRGESTGTYGANILVDQYGNQNMMETDEVDGTWLDVTYSDEEKDKITARDESVTEITSETPVYMFADFIKPEFTYEYSETTIGNGPTGDKNVKIVFDVTDKYFESTQLSADQYAELITVQVANRTLVGDTDKDGIIDRGEDVNLNGILDEGEDLNGNGILDVGEDIRKTLTKTAIFVMNKQTKEITSKATDYEIPTTEQKVGERYELLIEGLTSVDGVGYSGPMTFAFQQGIIEDLSGNQNIAKTITIGIDEPTNHPTHNTPVIVDVVNPIWTGPHDVNTINRTDDTVTITILGSDKYYASNTLDEDKITVYVDGAVQGTISKTLTEITDTTQLATLATNAGLPSDVELIGYTLTLGSFGNISGETKIVIEPGTIVDDSNNQNIETTIFAGNIQWVETNEPLEEGETGYPKYPAFRQDIVDFIDPVITYTYSKVEGAENPDIDYEEKTVTVKFTVTDKYLLESDLMKESTDAEGNTIYIPKNISVVVDGIEVYNGNLETQPYQVATTISATDIENGKEYTLVISNIQQTPNNAFNFSGPMQLVFEEGAIDDTSGNKNAQKTITLNTEITDGDDDDIIDVVDPIIKTDATYENYSSRYGLNVITRDKANETGTVSVIIRGEDKYLVNGSLNSAENIAKIKVQVTKPDGTVIEDASSTTIEESLRVTKQVTTYMTYEDAIEYQVTLGNFTTNEGEVVLIIPKGVITDIAGNVNQETKVYVGNKNWAETGDNTVNPKYKAFRESIVDFTMPTWTKVTSSITRNRDNEIGTVTLKILGYDIYYQENTLAEEQITVYVNGTATNITKTLEQITDTTELTTLANQAGLNIENRTITDIVVGHTLTLSNFGTNDGQVSIKLADGTIKDSSGNGNVTDIIYVGNPTWIETDEEPEPVDTENPKYNAFRPVEDANGNVTGGSIVDFIKPIITYQYIENTNPILNRDSSNNNNEYVQIKLTATDTNFLESNIELDKLKIYVDNMLVYGEGVVEANKITPELTSTVITNGIEYTLKLSKLELDRLLTGEIFERHSGIIKIEIPERLVEDTSGNKNIATTIIVDNDDGDDINNPIIVDFIKPIIYLQDKYIDWEDRVALITLRATDRFYDIEDLTNIIETSDISLWEGTQNITDLSVSITSQSNGYGYDFIIRLDNFEEEFDMTIKIPEGVISDTSDNTNDYTEIPVTLDNKKPSWEYVSLDTENYDFESENGTGTIGFNVKGVDKFLDLTNSILEPVDIKVIKDGVDITNVNNITVTEQGTDNTEKSKSYKIVVTGLTEVGTYSLVFAKDTLIDIYNNKSAETTITFSKSAIASNTGNYEKVTYHVTPDHENVHKSYVHELMSVNTTGTNYNTTTYRPSSLGELNNNGENPLFAEPIYEPQITGYTVDYIYNPQAFAGWAECDENGNIKYYTDNTYTTVSTTKTAYTKVYGLYDEIPNTVTNLKAIWEDATVVFVSSSSGNNSNDGKLPTTPVADIETAYSKLNSSGTATNNIIVIMDAVEWNDEDGDTILTGNATITSLYAGIDYSTQGAELKISSNMTVNGDVIFDNIELYADSTTVSAGTDYLGNGTYTNMLISNYSGNITLGRGITTPSDKYTFGAVIGGNYKQETSTGTLGTHTIRIEAGKYNNIIAGSTLADSQATTTIKNVEYEVIIGNMRDTSISKNDKLTITGYLAIGENELNCYPIGATDYTNAYDKNYAETTLYSGTFTGDKKFAKASENVAIYLRSINGQTDGIITFEMYGGDVKSNIYGGACATSYKEEIYNVMKFYGGKVTGNIFGQGANDTFNGSSDITLQGCFNITGNIFGGSNATTDSLGTGNGNTNITVDSTSVIIDGNIYGASNGTSNSVVLTGTTNITLNSGNVKNIYGSGNNSGNSGKTMIKIENGTVTGNIIGGAYNAQGGTTSSSNPSEITVLGGTIKGNIYGGNENTTQTQLDNDTISQNVNITIGDTDSAKEPTIEGVIYGSGKYDKLNTVNIYLIESAEPITVYGGSDVTTLTTEANIYLQGMTVDNIYGGGQSSGTVTTANIYLQSGAATDVYGGGYEGAVTTSNINLEGTAVVGTIYGGGSQTAGTVTTSNVTLKSGTVTNVFGGGNKSAVGTANVTLDGITINTIHGGSKEAGVTTTTNVTLKSGTVTNVFGGGLDVGVTTSNVKQQGATVTNIYGGNNTVGDENATGGDTETSNVEILSSAVENVYGGNKEKGTTRYTNINIHGTSTITGKLYGGGYKSAIGKADETGSTTINIAGGTINNDINGGSEQSIVYGTTNINIGKDATDTVKSGLTGANINILGTIYGAGDTLTDGEVTVVGDTNILMDKNTTHQIQYFTANGEEKSIYGTGNGGAKYSNGTDTDNSTIHIKDFGTETTPYLFKSIENTGDLYIGSSIVEITGALEDTSNNEIGHYYTLNTITNALTIYNNTTLYTQRGFNKVGGFNSYKNKTTTKATASINGTTVTTNVDNRIYTLEGINLVFAKEEVNLSNKSTIAKESWGDVTGMAFFGMYKNTSTGKQYDIYAPDYDYTTGTSQGLFRIGTYVEGLYELSTHNIYADGFYTNVVDEDTSSVIPEVIDTTNYTNYCDWIINAPTINYEVDLVASTYGQYSTVELLLEKQYAPETVYSLNQVSTNALKPDIQLVDPTDPDEITTISTNANNKFGLTMETTNSGWLNRAITKIYSNSNGSFAGDTVYNSDITTTPGTIKFKIYNSINITEEKDLGNVNIVLIGEQPSGGVFKAVIAVNLQTVVDELKEQYTPSFTDRVETELSYTTDSRIDLSYLLYKDYETTPYTTGDYRVLSTTEKLPAGTTIKMKDYGQGDSVNKVYYYHVTGTETETDGTRYLYRLSNFIDIGSTNDTYADIENNIPYYNTTGKYVLEKYDISIDFIDSNINTDKLAQETYLELRHSDTTTKYDNGDKTIKYNLYSNKNAVLTETISNEAESYSIVETLEIPLTINASILEQSGIMDTKYYDQIAGIAIQIVGENNIKIKSPELQNFKLTNTETEKQYIADENGVIRMPIIEGIGSMSGNYKLSMTQSNVSPGRYTAQVRFYTADDGKYYGLIPAVQKTFNITFISKLLGVVGVEVTDNSSRIINKSTGLNLDDIRQSNKAIDMTVSISNPTNETNIRVELYKRNPTYTSVNDGNTYTGMSYTLVDIKDYLQGTWETPETYGLTSATGSKEYIIQPQKTYATPVELEMIEFEKAVVENINSGEYKLVFKAYSGDTLVQTFKKTFIVTP